jgi:hypothetical protein
MERKKRNAIRAQREQLLTLVNGWDPAGLLQAGGPRDEYDRLIDSLLGLLTQSASSEEVAQFLEREIREHFGVAPKDASQFAMKVITWYRLLTIER